MDISGLLTVMHFAERLKNITRHSYTSQNRHESVAEHCWRLALLAYFVKDEFPQADMNKVMLMCLLHDFGEAFEGDIPCFEKSAAHEDAENRMISAWVSELPSPYSLEIKELLAQMQEHKTLESRLCYALDGIEVVIQHNEADLSTWNDIERELVLKYGEDRVDFSDYLVSLRKALKEETAKKLSTIGENISD